VLHQQQSAAIAELPPTVLRQGHGLLLLPLLLLPLLSLLCCRWKNRDVGRVMHRRRFLFLFEVCKSDTSNLTTM
jgi:hypothetical protein